MNKARLIIGKVLCWIGLHKWKFTPERSRYSWKVNMKCLRTCDARSHTIKADKIGRRIWG